MRPKQWIKNGLVFAALIFSGKLLDTEMLKLTVQGFIIFCFLSSSVYIFNDAIDKEKDKQHLKKCKRPIASGAISVPQAMVFLIILVILTFSWSIFLSIEFTCVAFIYFALNICYTFKLKHVTILDIMCIAAGFVLRALSGTVLIETGISPWLVVCTSLLALFVAIHKRKSELEAVEGGLTNGRKVLENYSKEMLRDMSSAIDSATIMAYCLYTFNSDQPVAMMCTIPFVIYGLFRYQYISHKKDLVETPELALLQDKPLLIDVFLWVVTCGIILYML
jgi:4-hydroxybenzoate polyprenyltransferase